MICVTIAREKNLELRKAWEDAAKAGVKLIELRLDYLAEPVDWKTLLRDKPTPALVTVRRTVDGGRWAGSEDQRRKLLSEATHHGTDWIDVEVDIARDFPRSGISRRIVSFHDMNLTPENLPEIADLCSMGDADLVKIAVFASSIRDSMRLLLMLRQSSVKRPTMALAMGEWGQFTRVVNAVFGENWTYASWASSQPPAPGMLSFEELKNTYRYERIRHSTEIYAVIGDPISHSKSPLIHNAAFEYHKQDAVYVPIRVATEDLNWFVERCEDFRIRGLSVTIPHKEQIIKSLTETGDLVQLTGSCNTVLIQPDPFHRKTKRNGVNTDLLAALNSLQEALPGSQSTLADRKVLLLGAGGVARSLAFGLLQNSAKVTITNRTARRAEQLAQEAEASWAEWESRHEIAANSEIVINCTSMGMAPNLNHSPLNAEVFHSGQIVFDTIYTPEWTKLLLDAKASGAVTLSGVDMFIRQAALQSQLFTNGLEPTQELMAKTLRNLTSNP